jgi:aspartyl-tRNA synthetase, bacterial type
MNPGQFYALPQSPQLFKQLLMVSGFDRYFQIVKCFRDEDLRADRQPEFTQIDCEMSFVDQDDVMSLFEGLVKNLFKVLKGIDLPAFPRMTYDEAMKYYGSDKPDTRFDMKFVEIKDLTEGKDFVVFDSAEYVGAICVKGAASFTRKELDNLTKYVQRPQVGAKGMIYCRYEEDGTLKSSVDKFYNGDDLKKWADRCQAAPGDLILVLCGETDKARTQLGELRLEVARQLGLMNKDQFNCLWVVDFPLLEYDAELDRYFAKHHPFTSPKKEDIAKLDSHPGEVKANAYDMVINGWEVGGGSVRIYDSQLQEKMFETLGFTPEKAQEQFGFLMNAFKYGAPPHAGIAFGLDRLTSIFAGLEGIRDVIAFPKNNSGHDVMIDAPAQLDPAQLEELSIQLVEKK